MVGLGRLGSSAKRSLPTRIPFGGSGGGSRRQERDLQRSRKDLEEERSPGRSGSAHAGNGADLTPDPAMEQGLGADALDPPTSTDDALATVRCEQGRWSRENGRKATAAATQCGCRRGVLRRVRILHRGEASRRADHPVGRPGRKRGGPQDRQRDATSPQIEKRRKPSRWCETTRAERDFGGWTSGAEARTGRLRGSGRFARMSMEGRQVRCRLTWPASQTETQERRSHDQGARFSFGEE